MGMTTRASRRVVARIATVVQLVALVTLAGSSGMSFLRPAEAASAATGTLLKTVSMPASLACAAGGGSVLTLVAGRMLGQAFAGFPILLAVGCPGSSVISFLDPNSAGATNPAVGAAVVTTVTTSTAPPAGGWRSFAVRPDMGDLIGCGNIQVTGGGFVTFQTQIYSIPLTSTAVTPALLFTTGLSGGTCDGLAWDSGDKTIFAAPVGGTIFHFSPTGTQLSSFGGPSACTPVIGGLMVAGSNLFVTCGLSTSVFQISKDGSTTFGSFTPANTVDAMACDPGTFAPSGNAAVWARDVTLNQIYAFALPLNLCGSVIGGAILPFGAQCDSAWPGGIADTTSTAGDGLLDCWKTNGIDINRDGIIDYTLAGASVTHHDIYMEIDSYSTGCSNGPVAPTCRPSQAVVDAIVQAFNNAPVSNPDNTTGIHLHVTVDDSMAVTGALNLPPCTPLPEPANTQDFDNLKLQFFGTAAERASSNRVNILAAKSFVTHYMISAPSLAGLGTTSGCSELPGNDLAVALGTWNLLTAPEVAPSWEGTIMHELGHNLGLRHGGGAAIDTDASNAKLSANCKPNYLSVMSYAMQMPDHPIPLANWKLDYSRLQLPTLTEGGLSEAVGVFGTAANQTALTGFFTAFGAPTKNGGVLVSIPTASGPINFNGDRTDPSFEIVSDNANNLGTGTGCDGSGVTLAGWNDWANLIYAFQTSVDFADGLHQTVNTPDNREITQEQANAILANTAPLISLTKTAAPNPVVVGNNITYTVTATNVGPKTATNVSIADTLPTGETFVSASPSTCSQSSGVVTCNAGTLNVGSSFVATIVATVKQVSAMTNQAAVSEEPDITFFQSNVLRTTQVLYNWSGFNSPINNPPAINSVQAGSAVPVKFALGGNFGANIFATGSPQSQQVSCAGLPGTVTLIGSPSPITSAGALGFNLVTAPNQYLFSWQTSTAYAGTCRQLSVQLNDGTAPHVAYFQFN
jgi:uncharacterized repeat protein (TIGR01451 family)